MGPLEDIQTKNEPVRMERRDAAEEQRRRLFDELMQDGRDNRDGGASGRKTGGIQVIDRGQISSMSMPAGFEKGKTVGGTYANDSFQEYHLSSNANVKFYFEYRGRRMGVESSKVFHDTLEKPPHALAAQELESLHQVLGANRSNKDDFKINSARTEDLNGKRVLTIEGRYPRHNLSARTVFVDSDGTGSAVQEITFQAPTAEFFKNTAASLNALKSIKWK
ncbi:MAG: hypothetical protein Q8T09_14640 [Candidatus Melainabacteria bacterium]|nr:hypothetical protein [Candidatus Melainabacteria bacterium]